MATYAIIKDRDSESFWVQGDEGRVNGQLFDRLEDAFTLAGGLADDGKDVDLNSYYLSDDNDGPDWDRPIRFIFG